MKATGGNALNSPDAPDLSELSAYWWRISNSGPYYESSNYSYSWDEFGFEEYLEIRDTNPGNGNIAVVDAVNNIAVTVTAPELGATPDYNPVYTSTPENSVKIDTEYIKWYKIAEADFTGTDKDIWDSMGPNEKFTTGYYYYIDMYFYPNAGYKITTSTTGTVNGMHHDDPYYNLYQDNSEAFLSGLFVPLHDHVSGTEWESDADNHWHICSVEGCGVVIESSKAAHTPDREAATETDPIKCSVCDYIITPALGMQDYIVEMPFSLAVKLTGDEKPAKETFKFEIYDLGVEDAEFEILNDSVTAENIAFDENGVAFMEGIIKIKVTGEEQLSNLTEGFSVRMVKGSTKGWTYASEQWRIEPFFENDALDLKIAVKEIVDGKISEAYANGMSFSVGYEAVTEPETPQTGDSSMMVLWIALLFASGFGVVTTAVYGKKRKTVK